jgi:WXG100 family type VII secretion target
VERLKQISVQLDNLRSSASKMQEVIKALESADSTINQIVSNMEGSWEGRARNKYKEDCKKLQTTMKSFKEEITERKTSLEQSISVYDTRETQNVGTVSDLSTEGIF